MILHPDYNRSGHTHITLICTVMRGNARVKVKASYTYDVW